MTKAVSVIVAALILSAIAVIASQSTPLEAHDWRTSAAPQGEIVPGTAFYRGQARALIRPGLPLTLAVHRAPLPDLGVIELAAGPQSPLHDFNCGPKGSTFVPCDRTFQGFCAEIANGRYNRLDGGYGACITPASRSLLGTP